jgi:hypothetical protein
MDDLRGVVAAGVVAALMQAGASESDFLHHAVAAADDERLHAAADRGP